ncbi:MAG TPA: acylphosphatase [Gammaproteobacteria bacterium]|nr:acylphosphatase [Gammaproteobacteria bacterium]
MQCMRCHVSGRVQGVFFRASTRHEAQRLGVTGYARNLQDGRVEVLVCGSAASVDELCAWLAKGPPMAKVSNVSCETMDVAPPADFSIG